MTNEGEEENGFKYELKNLKTGKRAAAFGSRNSTVNATLKLGT